VPGLTQTLITPNAKVLLTVKGQMRNIACFGCGNVDCKYDIWVDGILIDRNIVSAGSGAELVVTNGGKIYTLAAGSHTIAVKVDSSLGKDFAVVGFRLVVLVIPE
jgi:hypothetical protein